MLRMGQRPQSVTNADIKDIFFSMEDPAWTNKMNTVEALAGLVCDIMNKFVPGDERMRFLQDANVANWMRGGFTDEGLYGECDFGNFGTIDMPIPQHVIDDAGDDAYAEYLSNRTVNAELHQDFRGGGGLTSHGAGDYDNLTVLAVVFVSVLKISQRGMKIVS
jgi:hypothetical protein